MTLTPQSAAAGSPSRDDSVTTRTCPACGQPFTPSGRRRWCSDSCKQAAWRHPNTPLRPEPPVPPAGRKRAITVYECDTCGVRTVGQQRCDDCGTFMRTAGTGGLCPCCDEPVTIQELLSPDNR